MDTHTRTHARTHTHVCLFVTCLLKKESGTSGGSRRQQQKKPQAAPFCVSCVSCVSLPPFPLFTCVASDQQPSQRRPSLPTTHITSHRVRSDSPARHRVTCTRAIPCWRQAERCVNARTCLSHSVNTCTCTHMHTHTSTHTRSTTLSRGGFSFVFSLWATDALVAAVIPVTHGSWLLALAAFPGLAVTGDLSVSTQCGRQAVSAFVLCAVVCLAGTGPCPTPSWLALGALCFVTPGRRACTHAAVRSPVFPAGGGDSAVRSATGCSFPMPEEGSRYLSSLTLWLCCACFCAAVTRHNKGAFSLSPGNPAAASPVFCFGALCVFVCVFVFCALLS